MASLSSILDRGENIGVAAMARAGEDVHDVRDIEPCEPSNMRSCVAFESTQEAAQRFCLKDLAPINILSIFSTLDTSHLEISRSKDFAPMNIESMVVTLETSHLEISPLNT